MERGLRNLVAVAAVSFLTTVQPGRAEEKPTDWMQLKLQMSQEILAGLTRGDFAAVETHAQKMNVVNFMEKLVTADKPHYKEYTRQLQAFETANRELLRQSAAKNAEGATLAYVQLTISCVQCHKLIRDAKK